MAEELPNPEKQNAKISIHTVQEESVPEVVASWRGIFVGAAFLCVLAGGISLSVSLQRSAHQAQGSAPHEPVPAVLGAVTEAVPQDVFEPAAGPLRTEFIDTSSVLAESYRVFEADSGTVILEKNAEEHVLIASMTKLMTALITYERGNFSDTIIAGPEDRLNVSPSLDLRMGEEVRVGDVFNAMIVGSANDAAQTLANYIAKKTGRNFVDLMNEKAAMLGMNDSRFSNPYGFDSPNNYSTAADLQKLIFAVKNIQAFSSLGRNTSYRFAAVSGNSYQVQATNKLVRPYPDIRAIKTGSTAGAKEAMAVSVTVGDREFVVLVLASANRDADILALRSELIKAYTQAGN